jgi:hypothetical protein
MAKPEKSSSGHINDSGARFGNSQGDDRVNIRPVDLQVLVPRTVDVAKMASVHDQQAATQQQQLSANSKQAAEAKQRQVQTALSSQHEGRVGMEDLDQEKRNRRRQQEERNDRDTYESEPEIASAAIPPVSLLGHTIDIKT